MSENLRNRSCCCGSGKKYKKCCWDVMGKAKEREARRAAWKAKMVGRDAQRERNTGGNPYSSVPRHKLPGVMVLTAALAGSLFTHERR
jgi:hypothetical protein